MRSLLRSHSFHGTGEMEAKFTSLSWELHEGIYWHPKYSFPGIIYIHSFKLYKVFARHWATHYDMVNVCFVIRTWGKYSQCEHLLEKGVLQQKLAKWGAWDRESVREEHVQTLKWVGVRCLRGTRSAGGIKVLRRVVVLHEAVEVGAHSLVKFGLLTWQECPIIIEFRQNFKRSQQPQSTQIGNISPFVSSLFHGTAALASFAYGLMCALFVLPPLGCPKGLFGKNCKRKCNCANHGHCHRVYGACVCEPGRYGRFCHLSKSQALHLLSVSKEAQKSTKN